MCLMAPWDYLWIKHVYYKWSWAFLGNSLLQMLRSGPSAACQSPRQVHAHAPQAGPEHTCPALATRPALACCVGGGCWGWPSPSTLPPPTANEWVLARQDAWRVTNALPTPQALMCRLGNLYGSPCLQNGYPFSEEVKLLNKSLSLLWGNIAQIWLLLGSIWESQGSQH